MKYHYFNREEPNESQMLRDGKGEMPLIEHLIKKNKNRIKMVHMQCRVDSVYSFYPSPISFFLSLLVGLRAWQKMRIFRTSRASVFVRVLQTFEVTSCGSSRTNRFTRNTSFLRVFQTLFEVTLFGSPRTSPFIPRTSIFVRVFQTLEVTIFGSISTSPFIPRTSVLEA